jgi:hypothetical protein
VTDRVLGIQFHASKEPIEEVMRAPAIHVGTRDSAESLTRFRVNRPEDSEKYKTHALGFSKHAQFHDVTLTDEAANEAHAKFLEEKGMQPTPSIRDSRMFGSDWDHSGHTVSPALEALKGNKILRYVNTGEAEGTISYVVPTPHMNMRRQGQKDPVEQPVLPMDYSGIDPSNRTLLETKGRRRGERDPL